MAYRNLIGRAFNNIVLKNGVRGKGMTVPTTVCAGTLVAMATPRQQVAVCASVEEDRDVEIQTISPKPVFQPVAPIQRALWSLVPFRQLSAIWGYIASCEIPSRFIRRSLFGLYCKVYDINKDELDRELDEFVSFSNFFTRPLRHGVRVINENPGTLVSPVDARVVRTGSFVLSKLELQSEDACQEIASQIEQVKGVDYTCLEFLGDHPAGLSSVSPVELHYIVLYLAPGDYHRFHSPTNWSVVQRRHFPGLLVPLKKRFAGMFERNERVVLNGTWGHGYFSMTAVGALNVGSIKINFDKDLETNAGTSWLHRSPDTDCIEKEFKLGVNLERGEHVGQFDMGSSIVLVFEAPNYEFLVAKGEKVQLGQAIGKFDSSISAQHIKSMESPTVA